MGSRTTQSADNHRRASENSSSSDYLDEEKRPEFKKDGPVAKRAGPIQGGQEMHPLKPFQTSENDLTCLPNTLRQVNLGGFKVFLQFFNSDEGPKNGHISTNGGVSGIF